LYAGRPPVFLGGKGSLPGRIRESWEKIPGWFSKKHPTSDRKRKKLPKSRRSQAKMARFLLANSQKKQLNQKQNAEIQGKTK